VTPLFLPFFAYLDAQEMGSGNDSSRYNRGWVNEKDCVSSGYGRADSLELHKLKQSAVYLDVC
jgi:hypothetical protein